MSPYGEEGAEVDTGLVWGLGVLETGRPLVLIKDNKQPCEELSFSLSLRQEGSVSPQWLSLFELAAGVKSRNLQAALGPGETGPVPVVKSQQVHLQVLPLPPNSLVCLYSVLDSGAHFDSNFAC